MKLLKKLGADKILLLILLLAFFLYGYGIWNDRYANTYYTTSVGSMLQSFHNFFYASLDSAGSVTVDKPPVAFWVQSLFALVFGLHGWSVILPQALGGVGSVLLVYLLVKPAFGRTAARLAALVMAATPVAAAISRTNNIDALLVFTLLWAAWFLFRGTRDHRLRSLLAAFALIGVGFNEKMLQAYMVVPAFYLFYILAAKVNWRKKAGILAACTAVLLGVSLSWAVIVDSVPADKRPYIGSSGTNSVLNLAFGYNGASRLTGDRGTGGGMPGMNGSGDMPSRNGGGAVDGDGAMDGSGQFPSMDGKNGGAGQASGQTPGADTRGDGRGTATGMGQNGGGEQPPGGQMNAPGGMSPGQPPGNSGAGNSAEGDFRPDGGGQGSRGMNGGGMFNTGTAGPLRLFQSELSGQASWLLPFVAFGCIALLASVRRRNWTRQHTETVFWLAWLVPVMGFFSIAGFFHQYYLVMMAPPIAALAGAGWSRLWSLYRERTGWLSWLLPASVLVTAGFQYYIMHPYDTVIGSAWSIGVLAAGIATAALLVAFRRQSRPLRHVLAVAGMLVLLIGPLYWAATPITYGSNSKTPVVGPGSSEGGSPGSPGSPSSNSSDNESSVNRKLLTYLQTHNTGENYLFAALDYSTGGPYIIDEGAAVVILNGYSGSDPVYTTDTLQALVKRGDVKYFLVSGGGMGGGRGGNTELTAWIAANGTEVPAEEWQESGNSGGSGGTLYEVVLP